MRRLIQALGLVLVGFLALSPAALRATSSTPRDPVRVACTQLSAALRELHRDKRTPRSQRALLAMYRVDAALGCHAPGGAS